MCAALRCDDSDAIGAELARLIDDDGGLTVAHADLTDVFAALSRAVATSSVITALKFSQTRIGGTDVAALIDALTASGNTTLRNLQILFAYHFSPVDARHVAAALARNTTLREFQLAYTKYDRSHFGDEGACAFAEVVARNATLRHLDLSNNNIESAGVQALALAAVSNDSLLRLELSGNPCDDEAGHVEAMDAIAAACQVCAMKNKAVSSALSGLTDKCLCCLYCSFSVMQPSGWRRLMRENCMKKK